MFKDRHGVSRSTASPTPSDDLPEQLVHALVRMRSDEHEARILDEWLDDLLTAALSGATDAEVRRCILAANPGGLRNSVEVVAMDILAAARARLEDLQASIEVLEGCQDLLASED